MASDDVGKLKPLRLKVSYPGLEYVMVLVSRDSLITHLKNEIQNTLKRIFPCRNYYPVHNIRKDRGKVLLPDWYPVEPLLQDNEEIFVSYESLNSETGHFDPSRNVAANTGRKIGRSYDHGSQTNRQSPILFDASQAEGNQSQTFYSMPMQHDLEGQNQQLLTDISGFDIGNFNESVDNLVDKVFQNGEDPCARKRKGESIDHVSHEEDTPEIEAQIFSSVKKFKVDSMENSNAVIERDHLAQSSSLLPLSANSLELTASCENSGTADPVLGQLHRDQEIIKPGVNRNSFVSSVSEVPAKKRKNKTNIDNSKSAFLDTPSTLESTSNKDETMKNDEKVMQNASKRKKNGKKKKQDVLADLIVTREEKDCKKLSLNNKKTEERLKKQGNKKHRKHEDKEGNVSHQDKTLNEKVKIKDKTKIGCKTLFDGYTSNTSEEETKIASSQDLSIGKNDINGGILKLKNKAEDPTSIKQTKKRKKNKKEKETNKHEESLETLFSTSTMTGSDLKESGIGSDSTANQGDKKSTKNHGLVQNSAFTKIAAGCNDGGSQDKSSFKPPKSKKGEKKENLVENLQNSGAEAYQTAFSDTSLKSKSEKKKNRKSQQGEACFKEDKASKPKKKHIFDDESMQKDASCFKIPIAKKSEKKLNIEKTNSQLLVANENAQMFSLLAENDSGGNNLKKRVNMKPSFEYDTDASYETCHIKSKIKKVVNEIIDESDHSQSLIQEPLSSIGMGLLQTNAMISSKAAPQHDNENKSKALLKDGRKDEGAIEENSKTKRGRKSEIREKEPISEQEKASVHTTGTNSNTPQGGIEKKGKNWKLLINLKDPKTSKKLKLEDDSYLESESSSLSFSDYDGEPSLKNQKSKKEDSKAPGGMPFEKNIKPVKLESKNESHASKEIKASKKSKNKGDVSETESSISFSDYNGEVTLTSVDKKSKKEDSKIAGERMLENLNSPSKPNDKKESSATKKTKDADVKSMKEKSHSRRSKRRKSSGTSSTEKSVAKVKDWLSQLTDGIGSDTETEKEVISIDKDSAVGNAGIGKDNVGNAMGVKESSFTVLETRVIEKGKDDKEPLLIEDNSKMKNSVVHAEISGLNSKREKEKLSLEESKKTGRNIRSVSENTQSHVDSGIQEKGDNKSPKNLENGSFIINDLEKDWTQNVPETPKKGVVTRNKSKGKDIDDGDVDLIFESLFEDGASIVSSKVNNPIKSQTPSYVQKSLNGFLSSADHKRFQSKLQNTKSSMQQNSSGKLNKTIR